MSVSITHTQVNSVISGPLYQVVDTATAATGIDTAVFVYATSTSAFSHVAAADDMSLWPNTRAAAVTASLAYYRATTVTQAFPAIADAVNFATYNNQRLQTLVNDYNTVTHNFAGSTTGTITSTT